MSDLIKSPAMCGRVIRRLPAATTELDEVAVERAVTLMIDQVGSFTVMCTPTDVEALAAGFMFSEGLIDDAHDIVAMSPGKSSPDAVAIQLFDPSHQAIERNLIVASSCGLCGSRNIAKLLDSIPPCGTSLVVPEARCQEMLERLQARQAIFAATGAAHASGVFRQTGDFISMAEDIGRHTSLDKAIGQCVLTETSAVGCGAALSGRVSFEMVAKAARAGIEIVAAVSGPTSLAVEAADHWNITLCGFARGDRMNVYTHPSRIEELAGT